MKLLCAFGGLPSLAFAALGLVHFWPVARFNRDVAMCVWAFTSAIGLSLGLYTFTLRKRIASLEKRLAERE